MTQLVLQFTNISDKKFKIRFDGKVLMSVEAGETVSLPTDVAKIAARDLADKMLSKMARWASWADDLNALILQILGQRPVAPLGEADTDDEDEDEEDEQEVPATAEDEEDDDTVDATHTAYAGWTAAQMKAELKARNVDFPAGAAKAVLLGLLNETADAAPSSDEDEDLAGLDETGSASDEDEDGFEDEEEE